MSEAIMVLSVMGLPWYCLLEVRKKRFQPCIFRLFFVFVSIYIPHFSFTFSFLFLEIHIFITILGKEHIIEPAKIILIFGKITFSFLFLGKNTL
jgi:hypothetical protein